MDWNAIFGEGCVAWTPCWSGWQTWKVLQGSWVRAGSSGLQQRNWWLPILLQLQGDPSSLRRQCEQSFVRQNRFGIPPTRRWFALQHLQSVQLPSLKNWRKCSWLQRLTWSWSWLNYPAFCQSLWRSKLKALKIHQTVVKASNDLIQEKPPVPTVSTMESLLSAFRGPLSQQPGALDLVSSLQKFMNTKSKEMAFAELRTLLEAGASAKALQDLDFSKLPKLFAPVSRWEQSWHRGDGRRWEHWLGEPRSAQCHYASLPEGRAVSLYDQVAKESIVVSVA